MKKSSFSSSLDLCGCGRPVRYVRNTPTGTVGACNKYYRCPTYEELRNDLEVANRRLTKFQKAINEIDDYFEYQAESKTDQKKIYQILGNLTDSLKGIVNIK